MESREEAIPLFIAHFRKSNANAYDMTNALAVIGTIAVIEPLLEIFRAVKGKIDEWGINEDGTAADALVGIPGGIEKLKVICSPDEFERILVTAHEGDSSNLDLNRALGDVATPKAIECLIPVLGSLLDADAHAENLLRDAEKRKSAKEALTKIGKKAHGQLLKALKRKVTDRRFQRSLRKGILEVLQESGDEHCVSTIMAVMESDASVAEDARATIEAISKRHAGITVPRVVALKAKPLKTVAKTGDAYVDTCFQIEFQEFDEGRDTLEIPEAKAITEAGRTIEERLQLARVLRDKYPDFYYSYYWLAVLYGEQERYDNARDSLMEGLRLAKSKYQLCSMMGDTEWASGNLPEAVKWWIKSVVIQVSTKNLDDYAPFLNLSYVAEEFGLRGACSRLRQYVDRISYGEIRLIADAANKLYSGTRHQGTESMKRAIDVLDREYLS